VIAPHIIIKVKSFLSFNTSKLFFEKTENDT